MFRALTLSLLAFAAAVAHMGCSSSHFMPGLKPLFAGLDESTMSAPAKSKLAEAKTDFQCARAGGRPCHAHETGNSPYSKSRKFVGNGYEIIIVDAWSGFMHRTGPEITLDSSITGGKPFHYSEVECCND